MPNHNSLTPAEREELVKEARAIVRGETMKLASRKHLVALIDALDEAKQQASLLAYGVPQ